MAADPPPRITPDTIARMAGEVVGTPVQEKHLLAVAGLLQSLAAEMTALRAMNVGAAEPAFVYDAAETAS
jgi:hypothetical protein